MPTCPHSPSLRHLWFSSPALCQARGDAVGDQRCLKELSAFQGSQIHGLVLSAVLLARAWGEWRQWSPLGGKRGGWVQE